MKKNDIISVKEFEGTWIYKGDNVYSQIDNKRVYTVVAEDYPSVNLLPEIFVDENGELMYADVRKIND